MAGASQHCPQLPADQIHHQMLRGKMSEIDQSPLIKLRISGIMIAQIPADKYLRIAFKKSG